MTSQSYDHLRVRRLILKIDQALINLHLSYMFRPAGNEYLERLETLEKRRAGLQSLERDMT